MQQPPDQTSRYPLPLMMMHLFDFQFQQIPNPFPSFTHSLILKPSLNKSNALSHQTLETQHLPFNGPQLAFPWLMNTT